LAVALNTRWATAFLTATLAVASAHVALLADAPSHGLDAADYGVAALQQALPLREHSPEAAAQLDRDLTAALIRYLHELHHGRVAPAQLDQRYAPGNGSAFDAAATLRAALAMQDLALAVAQAVPALPQYQRLREALARYRAHETHAAWRSALAPLPRVGARAAAVQPGQAWAGVPVMAARLAALGDLDAHALVPQRYDGALIAAVQRFQQRHGLDSDGVIGRATWAAMQVTPGQRVRQLELTLERLRWTPLLQGPRMVLINIPEFVLRAYEVHDGRVTVRLESKVIVGKALDTRTPMINEAMRRIEFNPYWNVPASIARAELVPRLQRDPAYWAREGFEFVATVGGAADRVLDAGKLQAVLAGALRIRQRPGPRNALGAVKFVFPNRESIYLHDTPSAPLFEHARRDFSHGCIRVEQALALALFALHDRPQWSQARIRDVVASGQPQGVALAQPLPVLIAYATALVKDGRVYFFDDLYGHDRRLDAALRQRP
jgi:L,D-transpeptidase YcbB